MDEFALGALIASILRIATPLILAALAGTVSERSGVIDLGLEGKMLAAAFVTAAVGSSTHSLPLALAAAVAVGVALSLLHAYACVSHGGDQVVMGIAITMTAAGLTVVLALAWFDLGGQTPPLPEGLRLRPMLQGLGGAIATLPIVGPVLAAGLCGHNGLVYLAFVLVIAAWWLLYRTRYGLRLRAAGENPTTVEACGISVVRTRYLALACNGALTALAGAYLVLALNPAFTPQMTAGRGYMALAAMIFGKWQPFGALRACLLFGFLDALGMRLQGSELPLLGAVPAQAIQALPYLLTVVLLAGFVGRARAPAALGVPRAPAR